MSLAQSIKEWLRGPEGSMQGKMGEFQYSAHSGVWHGIPTSGDKGWQWILENSRLYKMPKIEACLLQKVAREIGKFVFRRTGPQGRLLRKRPVIDLGVGGEHAARDKLGPLAKAAKATRIVLVDGSHSLLAQMRDAMREITGVSITRVLDDFLGNEKTQYVDCKALVTYTGITVGNIEADDQARNPPARELKEHIEHISEKAQGGWVFVTFDCSLDEAANKAGYEEHEFFHLNFLDQAVDELGFPQDVRDKIVYRAVPRTWYDEEGKYGEKGKAIAGTIAHYAEFTEDAHFRFDGEQFNIAAGTRFLLKNSFKYSHAFFRQCVEDAGATAVPGAIWQEETIVGLLIKAPDSLAARKNLSKVARVVPDIRLANAA
jgi:uncharacterized SAM-dependent methyltransferase